MPEHLNPGRDPRSGFPDRKDFDRFYDAYLPRVYAFALRRLGSPEAAQEVTRAVFLEVITASPSEEPASLDAWVLAVTRRAVEQRAGE